MSEKRTLWTLRLAARTHAKADKALKQLALSLTLRAASISDHGPPMMSATDSLSRPVIMIVDDDPVIHRVFTKMLESFTGTVVHCHDGREALAFAQQVGPDLIITDALMPKLDGRELTRMLKQSEATAHAKIVVMTGLYKGVRYRTEAFRDFLVDAYMEKPIKSEKLWSLVRSIQEKAA